MGAKSEALARQFGVKVHEAMATLEKLSGEDWKKMTEAEKWSVGVTAHHVAGALEAVAGIVSMVIKGTLSVSQENIGHYARRFWEAIPLPEYMNKMGPYVIEQGQTNHQIITTYEFDESKFLDAWEYI